MSSQRQKASQVDCDWNSIQIVVQLLLLIITWRKTLASIYMIEEYILLLDPGVLVPGCCCLVGFWDIAYDLANLICSVAFWCFRELYTTLPCRLSNSENQMVLVENSMVPRRDGISVGQSQGEVQAEGSSSYQLVTIRRPPRTCQVRSWGTRPEPLRQRRSQYLSV